MKITLRPWIAVASIITMATGYALGIGPVNKADASTLHSSSTLTGQSAVNVGEKARIAQENSAGKIGQQVAQTAHSKFANIYGGLALSDDMSHVNIYLTKINPKIEKAIRSTNPSSKITFHKIAHTEKQMLAMHQASSMIRSKGIPIVEFGTDVKTGKEQIAVENVTTAEKQYLYKKFGKGNIEVNNIKPANLPVSYATRLKDSSPWNGGDRVSDNYYLCTTGFGVHNSSRKFQLTAGHCFTKGETIFNGGHKIGYVSRRTRANGGLDTELINTKPHGGSSHLIWIGGVKNPDVAVVSGKATSPVGYQVCQSGSYSGQVCRLSIENSHTCVVFDGGVKTCHLVKVKQLDGKTAGRGGDSGGPVYRYSNGLKATGTVVGGNNGSILYYENITNILNHWNVHLNVG